MTRVVTVDVSDEEYAALKYLSVRYGKSIQDVIRDAIRSYVTNASLTLDTEPWLQEPLWELAAALCPVSLIPASLITLHPCRACAPILGASLVRPPRGRGPACSQLSRMRGKIDLFCPKFKPFADKRLIYGLSR